MPPPGGLNELEQDTIKEIGNISLGSSATILSQLIGRRVIISTPQLSHRTAEEINNSLPAPCVLVEVDYVKGLTGRTMLIIDPPDALVIAQLMLMEEPNPEGDITETHLSALSESMNQMMGAAATALSEMFQRGINISSPKVDYMLVQDALGEEKFLPAVGGFIQVAFRIEVTGLIDSRLLQIMPLDFARNLVDYLLGEYREAAPEANTDTAAVLKEILPLMPDVSNPDGSAVIRSMRKEPPAEDELHFLRNVMLEVKGIVGRVKIPLKQVLGLGIGSIVELDSPIGGDVEILVNGKKVACGDIVAVGNQYGLKIKKILKS